MLRFIHASDLHLGNSGPGTLGLSKDWRERIANAAYQAMDTLIEKAIALEVDFVLFSGDILDTKTPTLRSQLELHRGLTRLSEAGIKVFMAGGNHDPLNISRAQSKLPVGVHFFGAEPETIPFIKDGVTLAEITGISYPVAKVTDDLSLKLKKGSKGFQIALLHTNVAGYGKKDNYAPSSLDKLIKRGFDYWALGHVHTSTILNTKPYVVYAGTTQGNQINEIGPKGAYLVEVDREVKIEFIETSAYYWQIKKVPAPETLNELYKALEELDEEAREKPSVIRLIITGRTPLYKELLTGQAELEERFREGKNYALESLQLEILPDIDYEAVKNEESLPGEFLREAEKLLNSEDLKELEEVLTPLYNRVGDLIEPIDQKALESIVSGSVALGLDLFWRGEKP